jgi:uncharacterized SAM-binding protein YcdF (DUF218 family)
MLCIFEKMNMFLLNHLMKPKSLRTFGVFLIVFSWILWGVILCLPFCKLTMTQYAVVYPVILVSTNIFWVGAALVGKELLRRLNIFTKVKKWLKTGSF